MKRTTLFVALASALSVSVSAYAHGNASSQNQSDWSKAAQRSSSDQQGTSAQQSENSQLVKQAQEKLSNMGKDVGTPDGQMDPKTEQALMEYQQENGLQPSGQLDQQTIAALDLNKRGSAATGGSSRPSDSD